MNIETLFVIMRFMSKIGVYPGSFDPFTNGHLYLVKEAAKLFDRLVIVVAENRTKKRRIESGKMVEAIRKTLVEEKLENVEVLVWDGVVVRLAEREEAQFLVRGLRDGIDYKYEENLAEINYHLAKMETVYFRAGENSYVSSSMVMELHELGEEVGDLVPRAVLEVLSVE